MCNRKEERDSGTSYRNLGHLGKFLSVCARPFREFSCDYSSVLSWCAGIESDAQPVSTCVYKIKIIFSIFLVYSTKINVRFPTHLSNEAIFVLLAPLSLYSLLYECICSRLFCSDFIRCQIF